MQGSAGGDPFDLITQQNIHQQLDELLQEEIFPVSQKFGRKGTTEESSTLSHGQQLHQIIQQHINEGSKFHHPNGKTSSHNLFEQCEDEDFEGDD